MKVLMALSFCMLIASCTTVTKQTNLNISKRGLAQDRTPLNDRQLDEAFNAAVGGKVDVLSRFHNEGYELNIRDRWGASLAFVAARHEKVNVLEFLHSIGHDLNAPKHMGDTPASYAKRHEKVNVLEFLRSKGHDVETPKEAALKELQERFGISDPNARKGGKPVVFKNYFLIEDLRLFLEAGLDPDIKGLGSVVQIAHGAQEVTLLQQVSGNPERVKAVLKAGANPRRASFDSDIFHHYFVTNIESIQLLLLAGVRPGILGVESYSSVSDYVWGRNLGYAADVLYALNEATGSRDGKSSISPAYIYDASESTINRVNREVVERVLRETENTLDLTDRQKENRRVLHKLAIDPKPSRLRNLLRRRAFRSMIDVDNGRGSTPLLMAMKAGFYKNAANLLAQGADPNATDPLGNTALHYAGIFYGQRRKDIGIVRALHAVGADPTIKNNYGHTPLDEVNIRGTGDKEVTKILNKKKRSRMRCF